MSNQWCPTLDVYWFQQWRLFDETLIRQSVCTFGAGRHTKSNIAMRFSPLPAFPLSFMVPLVCQKSNEQWPDFRVEWFVTDVWPHGSVNTSCKNKIAIVSTECSQLTEFNKSDVSNGPFKQETYVRTLCGTKDVPVHQCQQQHDNVGVSRPGRDSFHVCPTNYPNNQYPARPRPTHFPRTSNPGTRRVLHLRHCRPRRRRRGNPRMFQQVPSDPRG